MSTLMLVGAASGASQILVEEGVDTLHDAVAQAAPGDTLVLRPGLYEVTHTVLIDKDLTIRGSTTNPADAHVVAVDADEFNFQESEPPFDVETNRGHIFFVGAGKVSSSLPHREERAGEPSLRQRRGRVRGGTPLRAGSEPDRVLRRRDPCGRRGTGEGRERPGEPQRRQWDLRQRRGEGRV